MSAVTIARPSQAELKRFVAREARVWGAAVKSRRMAIGLTLEQLAELCDTAPQTIFKVERGQIVARDHLRLAIAFALACEPGELFPTPTRAAIVRDVA